MISFLHRKTLTAGLLISVAAANVLPQTVSTNDQDIASQARKLTNEAAEYMGTETPESYLKAAEKYEAAVALYEKMNDSFNVKTTLFLVGFCFNHVGLLYYDRRELDQALKYYQRALPPYRMAADKVGEGDVLNNIGKVYEDRGEKDMALDHYAQTLKIFEATGDKKRTARAYGNIANVYDDLGDVDRAISFYSQALPLQRSAVDKAGEARTLNNIGMLYYALNDTWAALETFNRALSIQATIVDKSGAATLLNNIGLAFAGLKEWKMALDYYERALKLYKETGDKVSEPGTLNNIGSVYRGLGDEQKALEHYQKALELSRLLMDRNAEAAALANIATSYSRDPAKRRMAMQASNESLRILRAIGQKGRQAKVLRNMMVVSEELANRPAAIIYGKQAVNLIQEMRRSMSRLDKSSRKAYLDGSQDTYRFLAELLISDGRLTEAQAVLDLLKEEEYKQLSRSGDTDATVPYSETEASVVAAIENLAGLERERNDLQKLLAAKGELAPAEHDRLTILNRDIASANNAFDKAIDALGKSRASASARVDEVKSGKVMQSALTELAEKTGSGVVALYTVLGSDDKKDEDGKGDAKRFGWVVMVTENRYTAYPVDVTDLEANVFQFRTALASEKYDPRPLGQKIYNAIFRQSSTKVRKTLEQDLREHFRNNKAKTVMWSLDGVLRYIPMAALYDGKQYLAETYKNTLFTKESLVWLMSDYRADWQALGFGVSEKRQNFDELPGVKTELETIIREPNRPGGILNGTIKLNADFKRQTFFNVVNGGAFPVVHISSHYKFDSARPENSYLLAGDGNLTFSEIKEQQNLFKKVDLLTLSACDTGVTGNGREAEGFAFLAQSLGAKSVIASLWKVSDAGTPELMIRFYKLRAEDPKMPKGEAFRRAQISLLSGETRGDARSGSNDKRSDPFDINGTESNLPRFAKDPAKPFAHPYYWASFVLIGNWR